MPKAVIGYSNTIIYKIFCNDKTVTDIYVGHTTNIIKRKYQHKNLCNKGKKLKIYNLIQENGGWDNWTMIEIAKYNCQDATEARIREQEHYDLFNPSLNLIKPISNNKYKVLQIDNDIKINDDLKIEEKYCCIYCDYNTISKKDFNKHILTNKHKMLTNVAKKYYCESCDYKCCVKFSYERHLVTSKHMKRVQMKQNETKKEEKYEKYEKDEKEKPTQHNICVCGIVFNSRTTLWRHKKTCTAIEKPYNQENTNKKDELLNYLMKENQEFKNLIL